MKRQFPFPRSRRSQAAALGLVFTTVTAACATSIAGPGDSQPVRCEIVITGPRDAPSISGRVEAKRAISGSYRLEVHRLGRAGRSQISQSGSFHAAPGSPAKVGGAHFGGDSAGYEAELTLTWDGGTTRCRGGLAERSI